MRPVRFNDFLNKQVRIFARPFNEEAVGRVDDSFDGKLLEIREYGVLLDTSSSPGYVFYPYNHISEIHLMEATEDADDVPF